MKKFLVMIVMAMLIMACNHSKSPEQKNASRDSKNIEVVMMDVTGMHCESCVKTLTRVLKDVEGVEKVKVSLENEQAKVRFDSTVVNVEELKAAIEAKGYGVEKFVFRSELPTSATSE